MTLTPERWQQVRDVLHQAMQMDEPERSAFLDSQCAGNPSLRAELNELLATEGELGSSFLEKPAVVQAAVHTDASATGTVLASGTKLGPYVVQSLIGAGGMGEVYRARDASLKRDVAIKVLPASVTRDPDRLRRFQLEAQAAAALNHPNILSIFHIGQQDGSPYIVTELLEGETLRDRLRHGALKLRDAIDIAIQTAKGLAAAHEKGIAHRDPKPENLFLAKDGRVKILDFGLAKLMQNTSGSDGPTVSLQDRTDPGRVLGTVGYMSPEQVRGEPADTRSDIFSLGCVLYEMLTGKRAFRKPTAAETMSAILNEDPPAASGITRTIPSALERVVHRCLEKSPDRRFQSASDLAFALGALSGAPEERVQDLAILNVPPKEPNGEAESSPVTAVARVGKLFGQPRWRWWLAAGVVCSIGAVLLWLWFPRPKKTAAVALKAVPLTSSVGNEDSPTFSPDGNQIAFSWDGEKKDNRDIYVKLIGPGSPLRLTTDPADDFLPAWSPDGRTIAFLRYLGAGKYRTILIPALGGPEQNLMDIFITESVWLPGPYLAWLPDSKGVIYMSRDSADHPASLFLLLLESREIRRITNAPDGTLGDSAPALSPDGATLVFSRMTGIGPGDLYSLKLNADFSPAGECKRITFFNRSGVGAAWAPDGKNIVFSYESQLWKLGLSRSGKALDEPHRLELGSNGDESPAISKQGHRLAYVSKHSNLWNIWRLALTHERNGRKGSPDTSSSDLIPSSTAEFAPQYSPDGKKIAFESWRSGNLEIWTCQSDGSNCSRLTFLGAKFTGLPHWSPDGRQIAFYSRPADKAQIYVINAEGGVAHRLTNDSWENFFPVWSRDGRWIYFGSNRSGTNQVWKIPVGGGVPTQVTKNGGFSCAESPDGKYLYYTLTNGSPGSLWKMPIEGGTETKVIDAVLLHNFAVTTRGVYYMSQPDPGSKTKLIQFLSFADGKTSVLTSTTQDLYVGFSLSPDERWLLYAPSGLGGSNIMLVEDFDADAL